MPILQIGQTSIPYTVRYSNRIKNQRIIVTPEAVEVVAPPDTPSEEITDFLDSKRRWLFNAVEDCRPKHSPEIPQGYISGAKVMYRGRSLMLQIESADVKQVMITCKSRFYIQVPQQLTQIQQQEAIELALITWKCDRVLQDIKHFAKIYANKLGLTLPNVKLSEQKQVWGTCGKDGIIRINWHLVHAPVAVLEYVVAHELVHLITPPSR
ncbi:putative metal-dependent hydrolase [Cylindrospermum stagnale PCC 7417]|uniref:Putative metal-dependent hydrolase n=1 Tax=Cylindrospermum stagnale PCC 7417 TaxID=56107 RepID=K9WVB5_9NOST|nr:YgjP-like metallopeptidase domain-containing protein [Cylindrospermum stagnale]AFZ23726.1 putative metal-dependent hydrolase [Cylindrospermum stagnale PCC 7417]